MKRPISSETRRTLEALGAPTLEAENPEAALEEGLQNMDTFLARLPNFLKSSGLDKEALETALRVGPDQGLSDSDTKHLEDVLEALRLLDRAYRGRKRLDHAKRVAAERAQEEEER